MLWDVVIYVALPLVTAVLLSLAQSWKLRDFGGLLSWHIADRRAKDQYMTALAAMSAGSAPTCPGSKPRPVWRAGNASSGDAEPASTGESGIV